MHFLVRSHILKITRLLFDLVKNTLFQNRGVIQGKVIRL